MCEKSEYRREKTEKERKSEEEKYPKRKPRGGILHGDDPTLAKRVEEELYGFGR
ncbi:MAG: hypothetical protein ACRDSJ_08810 [Rubrobacteraceae bacterium]